MKQRKKSVRLVVINISFIVLCAGILVFLFNAPKETTTPLPHDEIHNQFHAIKGKKEAEKFCLDCHDQGKEAPLPADHPLRPGMSVNVVITTTTTRD